MAQVKIYGLKSSLSPKRELLSKAIHDSLKEAFELPENKLFHRYFLLEKEDFKYPNDRTENYTIIELSIFEGRSVETKKMLINTLFKNIKSHTGFEEKDVEITIFETPKHNWGIRGVPGDELNLNYKIEI